MTRTVTDQAVAAIADGLRRRVRELRMAEERLARFAFTEGDPIPEEKNGQADWQHFALRALTVAAEPTNFVVLRRLVGDGDAKLTEIASWLGVDRLAVIDRVDVLTHTGCVARDLEHDRVGATALARGIVSLVEAIAEGAASDGVA